MYIYVCDIPALLMVALIELDILCATTKNKVT